MLISKKISLLLILALTQTNILSKQDDIAYSTECYSSQKNCCDPRGPRGPRGPQGPAGVQSWVQLYDRNFTNELLSNSYLNLSNVGISDNFTTGGYTLSSTQGVTNDTLTFNGPGHYLVQVNLKTSFLYPKASLPVGDTYQILFEIVDENNAIYSSVVYYGIIPANQEGVVQVDLSNSFIAYNGTTTPQLKVRLSNFNFDLAFEKKLSAYDIAIQVLKLDS